MGERLRSGSRGRGSRRRRHNPHTASAFTSKTFSITAAGTAGLATSLSTTPDTTKTFNITATATAGLSTIKTAAGSFVKPDLGYWHPGADTWAVKDADGNNYDNPVGSGTAIVADGSLNTPSSPQTVVADPDGYYSHIHTDNVTRYAAWQMSSVDHTSMYALWRFRIVTNAVNVNQKTFRIYGKGAVGIPTDNGQNYEGWYFEPAGGSTAIVFHPAAGVSPQQQVLTGLWQGAVGTNGNWVNDGGLSYASNLVGTGWHNLLTHWQLDGAAGGKPRVRFWFDGTAIVQPDGLDAYNKSGFAFGLSSGGGEWNDGPSTDGPFGSNVPSWLRFNGAYSTPVGFGCIRWWDTQHAGQALPGSVDTFGLWLSEQPINPLRTTF